MQSLDFHPSGRLVVIGGDDGDACIVSIPDLRKTHVSCSGGITSVAWNFAGTKVAVAGRTKRIHLISVDTT